MQASVEKSAVVSKPYGPNRKPRVPLSCGPCRIRKQKCNRQQPCQNCIVRNQPGACTFVGSQNRTAPSRSPAENMQVRINRLETLVTSLVPRGDEKHGASSFSNLSPVRTPEITPPRQIQRGHGMLNVDGERSFYLGATHWSDVLHELNALKTSWGQIQEEHDEVTLRTSLAYAGMEGPTPSLLCGSVKLATIAELLATIPPKPTVDKLIARFFDEHRSPVPSLHILHQPTFLQQYEEHWRTPSSTKVMWLGLLFSILSLSMLSYGLSRDEPPEYEGISQSLSELYRQRTSQCLMMADITKYLPYTVETLIYHGFAEQLSKKPSNAGGWILQGALVRVAIQMGYHRDPSHFPNISVFDGEMRRRIWCFILTSDAVSSFTVGLPNMIRSVDHDAAEPRNIYDWELNEEMTTLPRSRPLSEETPVSYLIVKSRVLRPLAAVTDFVCSLQADSYAAALQVDTQLCEAHSQIPHRFRMRGLEDTITDSYSTVTRSIQLEFEFHQGICVLHRRFLAPGRLDRRYALSRERCLESAMALLNLQNILYGLAKSAGPVDVSGSGHRVHSTHQGFILPAVILCLDLRCKPKGVSESSSPGSQGRDVHHDAVLKALWRCYRIWSDARDYSSETRKVFLVLSRLMHGLGIGDTKDGFPVAQRAAPPSPVSIEGFAVPARDPLSSQNEGPHPAEMEIDWTAWDSFFEESSFEEVYGAFQFADDGLDKVNPFCSLPLFDTVAALTIAMDAFEYNANPGRVVFGSGTIHKLPEEIARLNKKAPLILSTPRQVVRAENLKAVLNGQVAGIFTEATMHTPTHVTDRAVEYAKAQNADVVVSIGGGSTIGLGKAISVRTGLPHICIPTTYAGSEMTPILGETADGVKKTRSDPTILPGTVIYDVELTMSLPAATSATSGINAIAHAGRF
ncbi:hypothetical protein AOCH_003148, partial [Aspergillus ochraceoroseus]